MPEQTCASAITKRINDLQIVKNELLEAKYQLIAVADRIESWPRIVLYFVGIKKNEYLSVVAALISVSLHKVQDLHHSPTTPPPDAALQR